MRYDNWKFVFAEQRATGTLRIWGEPFVTLRFPKLFNLRTDPYERADIKEFPPSQKAGSFSLDAVLEKLKEGAVGGSRKPAK